MCCNRKKTAILTEIKVLESNREYVQTVYCFTLLYLQLNWLITKVSETHSRLGLIHERTDQSSIDQIMWELTVNIVFLCLHINYM
jgi:hypothetical protein